MQTETKILKKRLFGDNSIKNFKFFLGTSYDATEEDIAREVNKFFDDANKKIEKSS